MTDKANDINTGFKLIAMGHFNADGAAAAWFWQWGFSATFVRNAAGDYSLTLDGGGMDQGNGQIFITGAETEAATRATRFGLVHVSDTVKRVSTMQETGGGGGGASAAADKDFWIAVVRRRP